MKNVCEIDQVKKLFEKKMILDIDELRAALGTESNRTVFRYLKKLNYISSYTHAGKYYSLPEVAQFDQNGLWQRGDIVFSKYGTLLNTLAHIVNQSDAGQTNSELEEQFKTRVQNPLLTLVNANKLGREKLVQKTYLYVSVDPETRKKQLTVRDGQGKRRHLSDWTSIEILVEVIRLSSHSVTPGIVSSSLHKKGSSITREEIDQVFRAYSLEKKTPDSAQSKS
jgi:hypothetical protein